MADYDIHITGGTIVDGTGVPRRRGDVWIKDGKIAQIGGRVNGVAERIIDATGKIVAPGFVDCHTHYDAQIRWDPWCTISGWHGVTSVVLGNCGFGFAPCKPDFRDRSMLTMTRTEAIPYESMRQGMNWVPLYLFFGVFVLVNFKGKGAWLRSSLYDAFGLFGNGGFSLLMSFAFFVILILFFKKKKYIK